MASFYSALFYVAIFFMAILIAAFRNKINSYYVLLFASILLTNYGYMNMASAENLEVALLANKVVYLGASFSPFFLLMCLADLCKTNIKRRFQMLFLLAGFCIFFLALSIGEKDWYYSSVDILIENGSTKLIKEYGIFHNAYYIYLGINIIACLCIISRAFLKKKDVSYITGVMLLSTQSLIVGVYAIERIWHIEYTFVPLAYVISEALALILLFRISVLDITKVTVASMVESKAYGFIIIDKKGRFLGGDEAAKEWFPEIKELRIDRAITDESTDLLKQINKWVDGSDKSEKVHINGENNTIIEVVHTFIKERGRSEIHCMYLRDDTIQQNKKRDIEEAIEKKTQVINNAMKKMNQIQNDIIIGMASIVENRDGNTGGHITRTSEVVRIFVHYLRDKNIISGFTKEWASDIIKAAPLHDFGKIAIPDRILNKAGRFEPEEYEEMKAHAEKGAVIVAEILDNVNDDSLRKVAINVAHYHHERWDGTGYPEKLVGIKIPLEARIMALADVFDALVSKRVYKEKYTYDEAFKIIEDSSGTHFEPKLCAAFVECRSELERLYDSYED